MPLRVLSREQQDGIGMTLKQLLLPLAFTLPAAVSHPSASLCRAHAPLLPVSPTYSRCQCLLPSYPTSYLAAYPAGQTSWFCSPSACCVPRDYAAKPQPSDALPARTQATRVRLGLNTWLDGDMGTCLIVQRRRRPTSHAAALFLARAVLPSCCVALGPSAVVGGVRGSSHHRIHAFSTPTGTSPC